MCPIYDQKLIKSGPYFEYYEYEKPVVYGNKRKLTEYQKYCRQRKKQLKLELGLKNEFKPRHDNLIRARQKIRRLVNSNPDLTLFVTLTFDNKLVPRFITQNFKSSNKLFTLFIERLKRKFGEFKYIAVTELQKKSTQNVHYHFLCNHKFIPFNDLMVIWGHGGVYLEKIDLVSDLGIYMSKYLDKQFTDSRFFGVKKFFYSSKLLKPVSFIGEDCDTHLMFFKNDMHVSFNCDFNNDHTGHVSYIAGHYGILP